MLKTPVPRKVDRCRAGRYVGSTEAGCAFARFACASSWRRTPLVRTTAPRRLGPPIPSPVAIRRSPRSRRLGQGGAEPSPLAPLPPSEVLEPGFQLGKAYRVERLIGFGGMGAVYEVEHLRLQKRFAAKVLRPEYSRDATALARFEREAVAASRIHHPNIVEVVNLDETPEGRVFIVEELLVGFDLTHLTRAGPLPLGLAVSVGITVARALQAAHAVGIVHRDLKPANIFLARRAGHVEVKVLDFGISKILGEAERAALTDTGGFVGTPLYMAPEQAKEGGVIDARTDVYALGVILYELLAGAPPFTSKNAVDLALKHVMEAPEPLATRNSAVPGALAEGGDGRLGQSPRRSTGRYGGLCRRADAGGGASGPDFGADPVPHPPGPGRPRPLHRRARRGRLDLGTAKKVQLGHRRGVHRRPRFGSVRLGDQAANPRPRAADGPADHARGGASTARSSRAREPRAQQRSERCRDRGGWSAPGRDALDLERGTFCDAGAVDLSSPRLRGDGAGGGPRSTVPDLGEVGAAPESEA
jgi:serine/threonine protein kinase